MQPHRRLRQIQRQIGNFGLLTLAILTMMMVRPFLAEEGGASFIMDLLFVGIFLSGIYAARRDRTTFLMAFLLAAINVAGRIHLHISDTRMAPMLMNVAIILFFLHAIHNIGSYIWSERHRVNHDVIFAAISAYLLLGIAWAHVYDLLEMAMPGSFKGLNTDLVKDDLFYYSFVTLCTLGYGDIVPLTRPARALTIVEAVIGQLYIAVLIARLMGSYVDELRRRE